MQRENVVITQSAILPEEVSYCRDDREEPLRVEVVATRGPHIEVDDDQLAIGFGIYIRVYDKRVPDESRQRICGQEITRKSPRERGRVAENSLDIEHVHNS